METFKKNRDVFKIITIIFLIGSFLLWLYLFCKNTAGVQSGVFFSDSNDFFKDFFNTVFYTVGRTPYSSIELSNRNYLPLAYFILYPFTFFFPYDVNDISTVDLARNSQFGAISLILFLIISMVTLFYPLCKIIKDKEPIKVLLLISLMCSGITLYNLERANEIILTIGLINIFFLTYDSEKVWCRYFGCFCLAFASVLKLYPVLFGFLLLYKKRYKEIGVCFISGIFLTFAPFFWVKGNFLGNIQAYINALGSHVDAYSNGSFGFFAPNIINMTFPSVFKLTGYLLIVVMLICCGFLKSRWKQIMVISLGSFLITGQQGYYCLLILFFPFLMFLEEKHKIWDLFYLVAFLIILMPLQYEYLTPYITINNKTVINTLCIIMFVLLLFEGVHAFACSQFKNRAVLITAVTYIIFIGIFVSEGFVATNSFVKEYALECNDETILEDIYKDVYQVLLNYKRYDKIREMVPTYAPSLGQGGSSYPELQKLFKQLNYPLTHENIKFESEFLKDYKADNVYILITGFKLVVWIQNNDDNIANFGNAQSVNHIDFLENADNMDPVINSDKKVEHDYKNLKDLALELKELLQDSEIKNKMDEAILLPDYQNLTTSGMSLADIRKSDLSIADKIEWTSDFQSMILSETTESEIYIKYSGKSVKVWIQRAGKDKGVATEALDVPSSNITFSIKLRIKK